METYDQNPNRELNRINKQKKRRTAENESAKEIYCWLHMEFLLKKRKWIEIFIIFWFQSDSGSLQNYENESMKIQF